MKKMTRYLVALAIAGSLTTSSLFAQDYDDYDYAPATSQGMSFLGVGLGTWTLLGLTAGGIAAIAATHSSRATSHS